jgi:8-oxo-dGTP pyrophosphatase MutT (NUDIX family)
MLTFHAAGDWPREQIYLSCIPSTRLIIPEVEQLIADTWADIAARPGVHLFDGPMCRLESWLAAPDRLEIALSETSYKPFIGTNLHHPELADRYGRQILANPVGVSPALETADGWLMMGRRNKSVAYYPEKIHPFAGALEPRDAMDLFAGVRRELAEELGFTSSDIADIRCTGVAEDLSIRQPELIFRVLSRRTRAQIEATVDRTEHHASWSIPATRAGIAAALEDAAAITPVGIAALLLWGRVRLGEDYFRDRSAVATPMAQLIQPAEGSGIKPPKPPRG